MGIAVKERCIPDLLVATTTHPGITPLSIALRIIFSKSSADIEIIDLGRRAIARGLSTVR